MALKDKRFTIKIYDADGVTYRTTLNPDIVKTSPVFASQINGGFGECRIDLNLPFDEYGDGTNIDYMKIIKIYQSDESNTSGRLIYQGFISQFEPYLEGMTQGVEIVALGMLSLLSFAYYKNGSNFTVQHTSDDPAVIMKAIIDHFNTIYSGNLLGYDGSGTTIDTVGTNVDYDFVNKTWLEALKEAFNMCGGGWYWKVACDGQVYLKSKPSVATHQFTIGKDLERMRVKKNGEQVVNDCTVVYDGGSVNAADASSKSTFGFREALIEDTNIKNSGSADQRAIQERDDNKSEKIQCEMIVNSRYDIESIVVGDTCKVRNLSKDESTFNENMLITAIKYQWDSVALTLDNPRSFFGSELADYIANP